MNPLINTPQAAAHSATHPHAPRAVAFATGLLAAAATAATLLAPPAHAIDAHQLAPQDAELVVVVPNPQAVSDRIAELSKTLNVLAPGAANPMRQIMDAMGNPEGVATDRPLVIALEDIADYVNQQAPQSEQLAEEPLTITFVPVQDYGRFAASLGATSADGISAVVLADGTEAFVTQVDDYAAMANNEDQLAAYEPSDRTARLLETVGPYAERLADNAHAMAVIDTQAVGPAIKQILDATTAQPDLEDAPEEFKATMQAQMAMTSVFVEGLLDADATLVSIDLGKDALKLAMATKFPAGSTGAATFIGKPANPLAHQLRDLPAKPYFMAIAMDLAGIDPTTLLNQFVDATPEQADAQRVQLEAAADMAALINAGATVFYVPDQPAMNPAGFVNAATVYDVDDVDALVDAFADITEQMDGTTQPIPVPGPDGQLATADIVTRAALNRDAVEIEGVSLAEWTYAQEMPPELMQAMGPMAAFAQTNMSGYIGGTDGRVVLTSNPDVAMAKAILAPNTEILAADPPLATAMDNRTTPDAAVSGYVSFQGIAGMANNFLPMFGMPPIDVPADLPPLSFDLGADTAQLVVELTLPTQTLDFVAAEAQKLQATMQPQPGNAPARPNDGTPPAPRF
ncbi:MAG: hypothetical protein AAF823_12240 [Planctomycetota bacterium]